jgi:hypothetical protein
VGSKANAEQDKCILLPDLCNNLSRVLLNRASQSAEHYIMLHMFCTDLCQAKLLEHGGLELPVAILVSKSIILNMVDTLQSTDP